MSDSVMQLSPSEKILWEDEKVRKKGRKGKGKKTEAGPGNEFASIISASSTFGEKPSWKPGGKSSARSINVDLYASDMVTVEKVKKAPKYVSKRQIQLEYERAMLAESYERKQEEERKKMLDEMYSSPPSHKIKTYDEVEEVKNTLEEEGKMKKYAVRRGKHLFVKRGIQEYMDGFVSPAEINAAATKIQNLYRSRKAKREVQKKRREDSIELWSFNFEVAGCPLVAVFCIVKEPIYLVKNEEYDEKDSLEYDVYIRPSKVLTKEEKIARLHRQAKQRFCLEMTVIQKGTTSEESEIVIKKLITQAELKFFVPKRIEFTRFEHLDLEDEYMQKHMKQWLPLMTKRVKLKRGIIGIDASKIDRDLR